MVGTERRVLAVNYRLSDGAQPNKQLSQLASDCARKKAFNYVSYVNR